MRSQEFPLKAQIQEWINGVRRNPYHEQFVEPGLLVLRVKGPRCHFQGLHLALSDRMQKKVVQDLRILMDDKKSIEYNASSPDGRDWFHLYSSNLDFGFWPRVIIRIDKEIVEAEAWLSFEPSKVMLRLNQVSLKYVIGVLETDINGGILLSLPLRREQKPDSEAHHFWIWHWGENAIAAAKK